MAKVFLTADDFGLNHKSHPMNIVKSEHRVDFFYIRHLQDYFFGSNFKSFPARFQENWLRNLAQLEIEYEWIESSDLHDFIRVQVFNAST